MGDSILLNIKKLVGIAPDDHSFDLDVLIAINTAFANLRQLGVGPSSGFAVSGDTETWTDFVSDFPRLNAVKTYVHLKVRLYFDPPTNSALIESTNKMLDELEFRLIAAVDPGTKDR